MTREGSAEQSLFLSCMPAQQQDRRITLSVIIVSALIFAAAAPFARQPLAPVSAFIPIYQSALAISDFITAVILFGQFHILRSRALLVVAAGYLFTALMAIAHALSFPGLFAPTGLLGAGPQTTAWLYMFWHAGFPATVIAYALLKQDTREVRSNGSARPALMGAFAVVIAAVLSVTLITTVGQSLLPPIMNGNRYAPAMIVIVGSIWTMNIAAGAVLWHRRPHNVLDLWLMVVMCAWAFDVALSAVLNAGRFDLGFYVGRAYGLLAATLVLIVLLLETATLYARLVGMFTAEKQERQHEAEERRRIFETSLDLILVVDRQGNFLRVSPSSMPVLGYEPAELVDRNAVDFVYPDDLDGIRAQMRQARHGHQVRDFATRYFHKDGHIVMLSWSGVWSDPEQRHYFIGRDVTEQKRSEQMKDEFIATVRHELRTPVTTIAGPLSLLMAGAGGELPGKAKRLVAMAQTNSARLTKLVNDIVAFESLQTGDMTFEFQRVNIWPLIEKAIEGYHSMADKADVRLRLEAESEVAVRTDPDRLRHAIEHLLSNAIKFSPPGEEVAISIAARGEFCRVAIRDHGPGIPDDFKAHLFKTFAQVEATDNRQKGGAGLGLSIVKETMTRLNGAVGWSAAPSGGTIFHVDVPLWDGAAIVEAAA